MNPSPYRVLLCDLRSDQLLDVLPLTDVSIDDYIGKTGALQGTVPVPNPAIAARARSSIVPGRTAVWVERGRTLWWGGIVWTAAPGIDTRGNVGIDIQAGGWSSYLYHRMLYDTQEASQVDQFDIVRGLLDYVQNTRGGDIGITYDPHVSGVPRDRTYSRYDLPYVGDLIDNLAACENGFEWRIASYRDADGRRVKRLRLGHPVIRYGSSDVVLTHPGPLLSYKWPMDATGKANAWQSRGATDNTNQAEVSVPIMSPLLVDSADIADGWPRLDGSSDYLTVEEAPTLAEHARADAAAAVNPVAIPEVEVLLGEDITPDLLGATVRLRIRDMWWPDGLDARYRVVGITVHPPERGRPETARLYLEVPT